MTMRRVSMMTSKRSRRAGLWYLWNERAGRTSGMHPSFDPQGPCRSTQSPVVADRGSSRDRERRRATAPQWHQSPRPAIPARGPAPPHGRARPQRVAGRQLCQRPTSREGQRTGKARPFDRERGPTRDRIQRSQVSRSGQCPGVTRRTVTRSLAAGLAVCAIAPGTALAMPAIVGPPAPPAAARASPRRTIGRWTTARHSRPAAGGTAQRAAARSGPDRRRWERRPRGAGRATVAGPPSADHPTTCGRDGEAVERTAASTRASGSALGQPRSRRRRHRLRGRQARGDRPPASAA